MKRRRLLAAGCACCAGLAVRNGWAQAAVDFAVPQRFDRPDLATDEGGLWAMMEREERALRRSPLLVRDEGLRSHVQDIACKLGAAHCPDIRVYLVRTPFFNASMAPNGMMQVWTGLLLRVENDAQLAAIIGHEIAHYLQRHSVERLRDIKDKAAVGQVLALFGLVGAIGQLAVAASVYAYGREHENEADRIGALLMHRAGYDVAEAAKVWGNLLQEVKARDGKEPEQSASLFATHPAPPERQASLEQIARSLPGGAKSSDALAQRTRPFLDEWLQDEIKRGQYAESIVLLSRHVEHGFATELMTFYRGEAYRLRGQEGDLDRALTDYLAASRSSNPPPPAFRGIGLISRQRGQRQEAIQALTRYLDLAPQAPDASFIKSYITELSS